MLSVVRLASLASLLATSTVHAATPADQLRVSPPSNAPEAIDEAAHARRIEYAPRPASEPPISTRVRPQALGAKVLFVNFDGGELTACGNNDATQNCTTIFPGTVLPYSGDAANRAAIIQVVRKRVEEFGLTITDTRPDSGDYDMEMVGNWQGSNPDFAGIAPAGDCWDNYGGETSFTLEVSTSADAIAEIMLQELAHTWGLDHVDEQQDLLFPTTQGTNKTFRDECYQIVEDTELTPTQGFCSHHQEACGTNSRQNSHDEMMLIFGPSQPDTQEPIVSILAPEDGAVIDGGAFDLEIGLQDDQLPAVMNTTITISSPALPEPSESDGAFASPAELKFPIMGLPDGEYTIHIDAFDESDNPASDEITITVVGSEVPPAEDTGTPADDSGGDSGAGDSNASDGADGTGDGGPIDDGGVGTDGGALTGGDSTDEGCQCAAESAGHRSSWALLAVVPMLARRRRRTAC
jgi:MYXO-CTERM domain-containing protein